MHPSAVVLLRISSRKAKASVPSSPPYLFLIIICRPILGAQSSDISRISVSIQKMCVEDGIIFQLKNTVA